MKQLLLSDEPRPHGGVLAWLDQANEADLQLSVVTIGEIQAGIELTRDQDAAKAASIERNEDAMIAATAAVHKLTVVTRNVADFAVFGAPVINPFQPPKA
ncbi:MAG: hypothetical protein QE279_00330 [Rhodoferax sp.]|nr:hypothetical protein [Rhodoferax sp.]